MPLVSFGCTTGCVQEEGKPWWADGEYDTQQADRHILFSDALNIAQRGHRLAAHRTQHMNQQDIQAVFHIHASGLHSIVFSEIYGKLYQVGREPLSELLLVTSSVISSMRQNSQMLTEMI